MITYDIKLTKHISHQYKVVELLKHTNIYGDGLLRYCTISLQREYEHRKSVDVQFQMSPQKNICITEKQKRQELEILPDRWNYNHPSNIHIYTLHDPQLPNNIANMWMFHVSIIRLISSPVRITQILPILSQNVTIFRLVYIYIYIINCLYN